MSYQVTIQPSGVSFTVNEGETVLEAALRVNIVIPYCCSNAICGSCRGKVLAGSVSYDEELEIYGISKSERQAGYALFCSAMPDSDLVISFEE